MESEENYAYSIKTVKVKEPDFPYAGQQITCTNDVVSFAKDLQNLDIEKFLILYLDTQNKLICLQIIKGISNMAVVFPKEVLRHALLVNASALILVHNHPSGAARPSTHDITVTEKIVATGKVLDIYVHDHVIIGGDTGENYSMRDNGIVVFY